MSFSVHVQPRPMRTCNSRFLWTSLGSSPLTPALSLSSALCLQLTLWRLSCECWAVTAFRGILLQRPPGRQTNRHKVMHPLTPLLYVTHTGCTLFVLGFAVKCTQTQSGCELVVHRLRVLSLYPPNLQRNALSSPRVSLGCPEASAANSLLLLSAPLCPPPPPPLHPTLPVITSRLLLNPIIL